MQRELLLLLIEFFFFMGNKKPLVEWKKGISAVISTKAAFSIDV